jgi:hypothetical protein
VTTVRTVTRLAEYTGCVQLEQKYTWGVL